MIDRLNVTQLLDAARAGDQGSGTQLWEVVYEEVRQMAEGKLVKEQQTVNLQATMLVNEAYMRMWPKDKPRPNWDDSRHFFGSVSRVMEQYLIDYARGRNAKKRGSSSKRIPLTIAEGELKDLSTVDVDALSNMLLALEKLEMARSRAASVVRLRYLSGLTIKQTAVALEISERTVVDDWEYARAYLRRELSKGVA